MFGSSFWYYMLGVITAGVLVTLIDLEQPLWLLLLVSVLMNAVGHWIIRRLFPDKT